MRTDLKILIVEDEPDLGDIIEECLKRMGFSSLMRAADGEEAFEKCQERAKMGVRFDLIISDWKMPKLTGLDLLRKLRHTGHYRNTPFVMLTGVGDKQHVEQAISQGSTDYLLKPFKKEEFESRIKSILTKKKS